MCERALFGDTLCVCWVSEVEGCRICDQVIEEREDDGLGISIGVAMTVASLGSLGRGRLRGPGGVLSGDGACCEEDVPGSVVLTIQTGGLEVLRAQRVTQLGDRGGEGKASGHAHEEGSGGFALRQGDPEPALWQAHAKLRACILVLSRVLKALLKLGELPKGPPDGPINAFRRARGAIMAEAAHEVRQAGVCAKAQQLEVHEAIIKCGQEGELILNGALDLVQCRRDEAVVADGEAEEGDAVLGPLDVLEFGVHRAHVCEAGGRCIACVV
mmetsp:Transcript_33142/g.81370  ORF Transcript_33142/g.81370 Transcript_33142/m.81370 type:complete len:271 (+) Transcript_33142:3028-3840(+)